MILKCAYVFAVINTGSRQVEKVLILSEETPSVVDHRSAYALIFKSHGRTLQEATKAARHQLETSMYYRWAHDLLAN